jgi:hypothetical protein
MFLATGLTAGEPDRDPEEQGMRQQWFSRAEFERMLRNEEIVDALTLAAYARLLLRGGVS